MIKMTKILTTFLLMVLVASGLLFINGCEDDAKAEREQIRQEINTVTVNITNSNGSVTQVKLVRQGIGYIGPRGEYYETMPTEQQLRPVYGF